MRAAYTFPTSIYPRTTWLSPLWREQAYFQVVPEESEFPGDRWLIPHDAFERAKIEITRSLIRAAPACTTSFAMSRWQIIILPPG